MIFKLAQLCLMKKMFRKKLKLWDNILKTNLMLGIILHVTILKKGTKNELKKSPVKLKCNVKFQN